MLSLARTEKPLQSSADTSVVSVTTTSIPSSLPKQETKSIPKRLSNSNLLQVYRKTSIDFDTKDVENVNHIALKALKESSNASLIQRVGPRNVSIDIFPKPEQSANVYVHISRYDPAIPGGSKQLTHAVQIVIKDGLVTAVDKVARLTLQEKINSYKDNIYFKFVTAFKQEVQVLSMFQGNESFCQMIDASPLQLDSPRGQSKDYFMYMKLYDGDLINFFETSSSYEVLAALPEIFISLFKQVEYLHANGMAHGDIKVENILFKRGPPFVTLLCDFGSVNSSWCRNFESRPPEDQFRVVKASFEGDIWSLGCAFNQSLINHNNPWDDILRVVKALYSIISHVEESQNSPETKKQEFFGPQQEVWVIDASNLINRLKAIPNFFSFVFLGPSQPYNSTIKTFLLATRNFCTNLLHHPYAINDDVYTHIKSLYSLLEVKLQEAWKNFQEQIDAKIFSSQLTTDTPMNREFKELKILLNEIIESMLHIDPKKRLTATQLREKYESKLSAFVRPPRCGCEK